MINSLMLKFSFIISIILFFSFSQKAVAQFCDSLFVEYNGSDTSGIGLINDNGLKCGPWRYFYKNGSLKYSGDYKNGKRIGNWLGYYKNGQLKSNINYLYVKPLSKDSIIRFGEFKGFFSSEIDLQIGEAKEYFPNGSIQFRSHFDKEGNPILKLEKDSLGNLLDSAVFNQTEYCWYHYKKRNYLVKIQCIDDVLNKNVLSETFFKNGHPIKRIDYNEESTVISRFKIPDPADSLKDP